MLKNKNIRVIPRLDIKGPNVVKGIHLEGLRVVGRPELFAQRYYDDDADEIIYIDTVASLYGRNSLEDIVKRVAEKIFIPLTVGGGIRTLDDISRLLRAGADKVAINTAAIKNPKLIQQSARAFGSQCISISVQAKNRGIGEYECFTDNGREPTGVDLFDWVKKAADLGAGEILLTSIDNDGTGNGYDIGLISAVSRMVNIPVVVSGGAGRAEHVKEVIVSGGADAVCCASIFHYALLELTNKGEYAEEGNIEFLRNNLPLLSSGRRGIEPTSIRSLKKYLIEQGIDCRLSKNIHNEAYGIRDGSDSRLRAGESV